jgi:hypothetical protein
MIELPLRHATRYVQPLREGGSLPAVVDTDDGHFVVKFRGAGQGVKVLVAELIVGQLARGLGLPTPELALVEIDPLFGRSEPDPEIQDILRGSHGLNVGMRYLDGAFNFDAMAAGGFIDDELAAAVVWFDAFLTNPDRTHRNPNLLIWQRSPWLIDHGAALYAHHDWAGVDEARTRTRFPLIENHVLLNRSGDLEAADARLAPQLDDQLLNEVLGAVPDELLVDPHGREPFGGPEEVRARYRAYLATRLRAPRDFVAEAVRAREARLREPPRRLEARR